MSKERNHIDLTTLLAVLILLVLSFGVVYSASSTIATEKFGSSEQLLHRHIIKALLGIVALFTAMNIDYHQYKKFTKPALFVAVVLLIVTLFFGGEVKGTTRWLQVGGFGFQPSEFAKVALIFHLCVLIAEKKEKIRDFKTGFLPMVIWIGAITGFVMLQPNFSTGVMIFGISFIILFIGRARFSHVALTLGALIPFLGYYMVSAPYRIQRILAFLQGGSEHQKTNYQVLQGIIGFGNGGIFGVGPGESRQRDFFLPESYGDFIYSIVGEEYGFIGAMFILGLFLLIMLRGFKIAKHAHDPLGKYFALGITATITLYALVNAGVTTHILPTTGLPMPFLSYGGSSIFFSSFAVGVLLNISSQTDLYPRLEKAIIDSAPQVGKVY